MSPRRVLNRVGHLALSLGAATGVLCLVMTVAGVSWGVRPVIFLSGSMSPTIPAGSLALVRPVPAADLRVGDVVAVPVGDRQVTHRIVAITRHDGSATLRLRGDANARADDRPHEVVAAPRVLVSVPRAGALLAWLSRTPGVFVLAGYAAVLLALLLRRSAPGPSGDRSEGERRSDRARRSEVRRPERVHAPVRSSVTRTTWLPRHRSRTMIRVVTAAAVLGLGTCSAVPARAAWSDPVPVSGSTVGTYTVPAPATFTCGALGALSVRFHWTAVTGATNYTLHYGASGAQTTVVTGTTTVVTAVVSGGTAWVQANRNFGATTWTSAASPTRSYTVAAVSLCS